MQYFNHSMDTCYTHFGGMLRTLYLPPGLNHMSSHQDYPEKREGPPNHSPQSNFRFEKPQ